ncbi:right-handed parallel beta-helix repeat-containing protein [Sphingomonas montanisoli]|uniref:Right-handed parallel beta-helix repeat-containing protein n=1 Tax=Sphingomonas montanisoli TaxID=2606412 RepID=A0A5D9C8D6_9SPHN|nr:right-handed parallel beta-helix repeat-containing protein [Sphingomonas montanisoli]TZG27989.1 right-handed parallel beta-helix repeat-containing protein [Sphingomonas montanisoli]
MRIPFVLLFLAAAPVGAAPYTLLPGGQGYDGLQAAVDAVGDGDATILIAPGVHRDCAVQSAGRITYRGAIPGKTIFERAACEEKASLVLRGRGAVVEGLLFRRLGVSDGNAAGIRLEKGPLVVTNSIFRDSEQGILGNDDPQSDIRIDRSTFSGLGRCDRDLACAHSIYIGHYKSLTITRSRFDRGRGGHYVKSRSGRIAISDSSFDDTRGHTTNYMVDLPAGATGTIQRNIFVQGRDKENHSAFVAVGAESRDNPSAGLAVVGNRAHQAPGLTWPAALVADWTKYPMRIERNVISPRIAEYRGAEGAEPPSLKRDIRRVLAAVRDKLLG